MLQEPSLAPHLRAGSCSRGWRALLGCCLLLACLPRGELAEYSSGMDEGGAGGGPAQPGAAGGSQGGTAGGGPGGAAGGGAGGAAAPGSEDAGTTPASDAAPPADAGDSEGAAASPRVLSTVPASGASGVTRGTSLAIAFDVPMDRASVEAAIDFGNLGQGTPAFRWDASGRLLNIELDAPLAYATGSDPQQVEARRYEYRIGSAARDLEGNGLTDTRVSFTTLRELTVQLSAEADSARTGNWRSDGVYGTDSCAPAGTSMCIGDSSFGPNASYRGFTSFDLSSLPAAAVELSGATFRLQIGSLLGAPSAGLGPLLLERAWFAAIGPESFAATGAELGSAAAVQVGTLLSADVLAAVRSDWRDLGATQFRLRFQSPSDGDGVTDLVFCSRASASLSVTYLLP